MLLVLACTPELELAEVAYDHAGCVVTTDLDDVVDDTRDAVTVRLLRDAERAWSTDVVYADGSHRSERAEYDELGCRTGYTATSWSSGQGTAHDGQSAECDAYGNWVRTDSWEDRPDDRLDRESEVRRYANAYDGGLLVEQVTYDVADDGGESTDLRTTYAYDGARRVVEEIEHRSGYPYSWRTYGYDERGNLADASLEDPGDFFRWAYRYDPRDRLVEVTEDDGGEGVVNARTTWTYADDTPRPSVMVTDEGDDGTVDETVTYTWDCPP